MAFLPLADPFHLLVTARGPDRSLAATAAATRASFETDRDTCHRSIAALAARSLSRRLAAAGPVPVPAGALVGEGAFEHDGVPRAA
jgi:hypothetical protein